MEVDPTTHCWSILDSVTSKQYHIELYIGMGRMISCWPSLPLHVETEIWFEGEGKAVEEIEAEVRGLHVYSFLCCTKVFCAPHCSWCCPTPFHSSIWRIHDALHHKYFNRWKQTLLYTADPRLTQWHPNRNLSFSSDPLFPPMILFPRNMKWDLGHLVMAHTKV